MVTASMCVVLRGVFRRHGVMSAAIVHGLDVTTASSVYQRFVPVVFRSLDLVMPVSRATGEQCLLRGLDARKLNPIPNGVDTSRFAAPVFRQEERRLALGGLSESDNLERPPLILCSVGRHVRRKGFAWFVENVMPQLPGDVHYWLAGQGPETDSIRATIVRCNLGGRVRLLGRVSETDLETLYRGADLFVMPNIPVPGDMEGFGVVILEAGMNGMPTIGARIEGIAEVIRDGANGMLVDSLDATAFVEAIGAFLRDPSRMESASREAFEFTRSRFSWQSVGAEYLRVLERFRNGLNSGEPPLSGG